MRHQIHNHLARYDRILETGSHNKKRPSSRPSPFIVHCTPLLIWSIQLKVASFGKNPMPINLTCVSLNVSIYLHSSYMYVVGWSYC